MNIDELRSSRDHALSLGVRWFATADELKRMYASGERNFDMVNAAGENLSGTDLSGSSFRGANFAGANLSKCNLSSCNFAPFSK